MTRYVFALLPITLLATPSTARADDQKPPPLYKAWALELGVASGGPVLFRDTPDMRLEDTTVFQYGGRLGFVMGDAAVHTHRVGLAVRYDTVAHSESRKLAFVTPELVYEAGHPVTLQLGAGYAAAVGTADYASEYSGIATDAAIRWTLGQPRASAVAVSMGLAGRVILHTADLQQSSAFVGAQIEVSYLGGNR